MLLKLSSRPANAMAKASASSTTVMFTKVASLITSITVKANLPTRMVATTMVTGETVLQLAKLPKFILLVMSTKVTLSRESLTVKENASTRTVTDMLVLGKQTLLLVTVFFITQMETFILVTGMLTKR